ncbi:MAG: hypothetical protein WC026_16480 [Hyphomicrobium sp.]|uniref:head-tail connector protein n=1 Tax=Hyphomicrobium sp. TaxID=82 RepID=UPI003561B480
MWYPAKVTAPPASEPVTSAEVKKQCGIASADTSYDAMITRMIASERGYVERYCSIKVVTQAVDVTCDGFCDFARFPVAPLQSISSIAYVDAVGQPQTLSSAVYQLREDGLQPEIERKHGQVWPAIQSGSRITVTAIVGFAAVPEQISTAILLRIGRLFSLSKADPALRKRVVEGVGSREWDQSGAAEAGINRAVADLLEDFRCWPLS